MDLHEKTSAPPSPASQSQSSMPCASSSSLHHHNHLQQNQKQQQLQKPYHHYHHHQNHSTSSSRARAVGCLCLLTLMLALRVASPHKFNTPYRYAEAKPAPVSAAKASLAPNDDETIIPSPKLSKKDLNTLLRASFTVGHGKTHRRAVIVTAASHDVDRFAANLRCFVQQTSRKDIVLFALDTLMHAHATGVMRVPTVPWYSVRQPVDEEDNLEAKAIRDPTNKEEEKKQPHLFGTHAFSGITLSKLDIVRNVLEAGYDVLFTDVDVVWCRDLPSLFAGLVATYPQYDIFIQSNQKEPDVLGQVNTGFYYVKRGANILDMYARLAGNESVKWHNRSGDDQTLFWGFACKGGRYLGPGNGVSTFTDVQGRNRFRCQWRSDDKIKQLKETGKKEIDETKDVVNIMFLPVREFPNGSADPKGRALVHVPKGYYRDACRSGEVAMWHVNFCPGQLKERRLREQNVWIADDRGKCTKL